MLTVLRGEVPDSVPRSLYGTAIGRYNSTTLDLFKKKTGRHPRDCFRQDLRGLWPSSSVTATETETTRVRRRQIAQSLSSAADVETLFGGLNFDDLMVKPVKRAIDAIHSANYPALYVGSCNDFETPFGMRGREQFFIDLAERGPWLEPFLDGITRMAECDARRAALAGADLFGIGDDLGSQRGLLISPQLWRELFKPRLKRIIDAVKNTNAKTAFFLHSDGDIREIIPDLIEIGVDVLNPIQPEVMDPAEIKRLFGKDLVFCGAISVQHTLSLATPEDVFNEVKLRMETIGADGGYLMAPSHLINPDIPWENIVAFFEAAETYGRYDGRR